jgi:Carboxypeptidase regulatory-like domain
MAYRPACSPNPCSRDVFAAQTLTVGRSVAPAGKPRWEHHAPGVALAPPNVILNQVSIAPIGGRHGPVTPVAALDRRRQPERAYSQRPVAPRNCCRALSTATSPIPAASPLPALPSAPPIRPPPFGREVTTNSLGEYTLPTLPPGTYDHTVSASGFSPFSQKGIVVRANEVARVNVPMVVGAVNQDITVITVFECSSASASTTTPGPTPSSTDRSAA